MFRKEREAAKTGTRRYGFWAGNPKGYPENVTHCIEDVYPPGRHSMIPYQCARKRGHGKTGLYCKQHSRRELPHDTSTTDQAPA